MAKCHMGRQSLNPKSLMNELKRDLWICPGRWIRLSSLFKDEEDKENNSDGDQRFDWQMSW